uniref:Uncharacterized protein n=1 Tax=Ananas comosus var. bracteatus TaxID=296719 RepID=A0A6V7Q462_ANACO|nr:unnamed protein product [Ananas comosus var. bracteatus]
MKKTNEYCVDIYDNSFRRRLARRKSEVRLAVSVIRPGDRLPAYGYADCEKLFPLPSHKLRDPEEAEIEVLRMLDTISGMLRSDSIPVPREDMVDIGYWIAPEAAEMAAAAHDYGVGASIAVHIQLFPRTCRRGWSKKKTKMQQLLNPSRKSFKNRRSTTTMTTATMMSKCVGRSGSEMMMMMMSKCVGRSGSEPE